MDFWHIQLHPNNRTNFTPEKILNLLQDKAIIGIGDGWENDGGQPEHFQNWMQVGDIVAVRDGGTPVALVMVTGPCVDNKDQTEECWFDLIRPIKILSTMPPTSYNDRYFYMTSCSLQREVTPAFVRFWYNSVEKEKRMEDLRQLLEQCHNLILTGAPGTGKSFLAMQLANALTGDSRDTPPSKRHSAFVQFHPSYDYTDFVEGLRPTPSDKDGNIGFERKDGIFKEFCKNAIAKQQSNFEEAFNALRQELVDNYSIDNPLELKTEKGTSFRVVLNSNNNLSLIPGDSGQIQGSMTAEKIKTFLTDKPYEYWGCYFRGVIKYLKDKHGLTTSEESPDQKYVFIIDEINRGDIAKIFGELFFAIDPGYRNADNRIPIKTQYQNLIQDPNDPFADGFYIPDNVYIIGTMNDIDRNVESMDFAVRRRFTWRQIAPEDTQAAILAGLGTDTDEAKKRMDRLNAAIRDEKSQLGENFCIGAAYFKKIDSGTEKWSNLWNFHLKPLLDEYVRGLPDAEKMIRKFKAAYDGNAQTDANTSAQ